MQKNQQPPNPYQSPRVFLFSNETNREIKRTRMWLTMTTPLASLLYWRNSTVTLDCSPNWSVRRQPSVRYCIFGDRIVCRGRTDTYR